MSARRGGRGEKRGVMGKRRWGHRAVTGVSDGVAGGRGRGRGRGRSLSQLPCLVARNGGRNAGARRGARAAQTRFLVASVSGYHYFRLPCTPAAWASFGSRRGRALGAVCPCTPMARHGPPGALGELGGRECEAVLRGPLLAWRFLLSSCRVGAGAVLEGDGPPPEMEMMTMMTMVTMEWRAAVVDWRRGACKCVLHTLA